MGLTEALSGVAKATYALDEAREQLIREVDSETIRLVAAEDVAGLRALAQKLPTTWHVVGRIHMAVRNIECRKPAPKTTLDPWD